ncbi:MAG: YfiR/HmsC family protein [Ignavibacteria bacterium]|nr:YfiR/HmsC family protein [Ignavibacteria bacterium]
MKNNRQHWFCFWAFLFAYTGIAVGQTLPRDQIISAYIYNFAKNIYWPNEESLREFNFLIIGKDENIIREMQNLSKTKKIRDKSIKISVASQEHDFSNVQLIFVTRDKLSSVVNIFDKIEGKNILLITDGYSDKRIMMINFIQAGDEKTIRFEINKANILNQHLIVLQDIILLGGSEVDVASLYRQGQESLRKLQQRIDGLENSIEEKSFEIDKQKENLVRQAEKIREQQTILNNQAAELSKGENELAAKIKEINRQQEFSDKLSMELLAQNKKIAKGNDSLAVQKHTLETQMMQIRNQENALQEKMKTINKQQFRLDFLYLIALCTIFIFSIVYYRYAVNKKLNKELEVKVNDRTLELRNSNDKLSVELQERTLIEEALRQSEIHYRYLFHQNPMPMLVYELSNLRILAVNDAFIYHYKYSLDEALLLQLSDLYPEEEKPAITELSKHLRGMEYVGEWHHITKDERKVTIEVRSHELTFDGKTARIAVINDITERKAAEQALKEYQESLEEKVKQRTYELEIAKERAESADRTKSAFLATMSHELRTPLNSIIGFTGILLQERPGPLNPEQKKQLGMAQNSAKHLLSLINDILDISKIESGQMKVVLEEFSISDVITKVVSLCNPLAQKKNLPIHINVDPDIDVLTSDKLRIQQVLFNLVSNAIKFTDFGSVKIESLKCDDCIRVNVIDSGVGIEENQLEKLFKPFMQVDTGLTRKHEGTGLGLSICKHILDILGGKIEVSTTFGSGSTFSIFLPLQKGA